MRFVSLTALAFGPFRDRTFEFKPGMNIVHGPNEAGKSSLHAALQSGLCGVRRGRGSRTASERDFAARHKPWAGEGWSVRVRVTLDGGRTVEIFQDLDGRTTSRALDVDLARDCSAEILNEGTPDGALWLGLDRVAFPATACVRQAQVLSVRDHSAALQQFLQSAAANAGRDATAAAALERLDEFHREHVGQDRANSTKPLRAAGERVRVAEAELQAAAMEHANYLGLLEREGEHRRMHAEAAAHLRVLRAAHARAIAAASRRRFERARELAARHPNGRPASLVEADARAQAATRALRAWESRPEPVALAGPSAAELVEELQRAEMAVRRVGGAASAASLALEERPFETRPDPETAAAARRFQDTTAALERHRNHKPTERAAPATNGATIEELRDLARDLEATEPIADATVLEQRADLERAHAARRVRGRMLGGACVAALLTALMLFAVRSSAIAVGTAVMVALALSAWMLRHIRSGIAMREATRNILAAIAAEDLKRSAWRHTFDAAVTRAGQYDLPAEAKVLRALVQRCDEHAQEAWRLEEWKRQLESLQVENEAAAAALAGGLRARGISLTGNLADDYQSYERACTARARLATLQDDIARREREEKSAAQAMSQRSAVESELRDAARACGIKAGDFEAMRHGLQQWMASHARKLAIHQAAVEEWTELETLLAGMSLAAVEAECEAATAHAEALASALTGTHAATPTPSPDDLAAAELAERHAAAELARIQSEMAVRAQAMRPVAEAEEQLAIARTELQRLRRLDSILESTRGFLEKAQERVHRTVAPILASTLQGWLPEVTAGRYVGVLVDPDSLAVKVQDRDGAWREADMLSHGTAEQVYLLLRAAMAMHLTAGRRESCPLVFDDVTVHCDAGRKSAILDSLRMLSRERQVIVFTQEDAVLAWAKQHCTGTSDHIVQLTPA